jgi:hypothetical protein
MSGVGRLLGLVGALGVAAAAFLPWVTVRGLPLQLHLLGGAEVSPAHRRVVGTDTAAWPFLLAGAVLAAGAALLGRRRILLLLGTVGVLVGAALTYYVMNVIDIRTRGETIEHAAASLAVTSSTGPGPFVLTAGGVCMFIGALMRRS